MQPKIMCSSDRNVSKSKNDDSEANTAVRMLQLYTDETVTTLQANAILAYEVHIVSLDLENSCVDILLITGTAMFIYFRVQRSKMYLVTKMLLKLLMLESVQAYQWILVATSFLKMSAEIPSARNWVCCMKQCKTFWPLYLQRLFAYLLYIFQKHIGYVILQWLLTALILLTARAIMVWSVGQQHFRTSDASSDRTIFWILREAKAVGARNGSDVYFAKRIFGVTDALYSEGMKANFHEERTLSFPALDQYSLNKVIFMLQCTIFTSVARPIDHYSIFSVAPVHRLLLGLL